MDEGGATLCCNSAHLNQNILRVQFQPETDDIPLRIQYLPLDAAKTYREVEMDENVLNQVIAQHLYQEGYFDIAEQFEKVRSFLYYCLSDHMYR